MGLPFAFFFGTLNPGESGHYFYLPSGEAWPRPKFPFNADVVDGLLLDTEKGQVQGLLNHAIINGWTVVSAWDRTGDRRHGSLAAFIFAGELPLQAAISAAEMYFPTLWKRIHPKVRFGSDIIPLFKTDGPPT
jgi:hypothetical protein